MTVYKRNIYEFLKWKQYLLYDRLWKQLFLIHYIYTSHAIVVKLNGFRTRNSCFGCWTFRSSHYVKYPTHVIKMPGWTHRQRNKHEFIGPYQLLSGIKQESNAQQTAQKQVNCRNKLKQFISKQLMSTVLLIFHE